jgi:hypothetical protein
MDLGQALTSPYVRTTTLHTTTRQYSAEGGDFETSQSGLKFKILKEGTGAIPAPGQTINGASGGIRMCVPCVKVRDEAGSIAWGTDGPTDRPFYVYPQQCITRAGWTTLSPPKNLTRRTIGASHW